MGILQKQKALQNFADEKIIYGEQLFPVSSEDLQSIVHRSIGALTFLSSKKQPSAGSGVLISQDLVLTAAHNIYNKIQNTQNSSIRFRLPTNGVSDDYIQVEKWKYLEQFKICPNNMERLKFDYALLKLKKPVNYEKFPYVAGVCTQCLMVYRQQQIEIYGYPTHGQNFVPLDKTGKRLKLQQYGLTRSDRIIEIDYIKFRITYAISTKGGQSGCPVIADEKIIAIHCGAGQEDEQFNVGRLMTFDLIDNLYKWVKQLNGKEFQYNHYELYH